MPKPVDLSDVIDFEAVRESYERESQLPVGITAVKCESCRPTFRLNDRPGIYSSEFVEFGVLSMLCLSMRMLTTANDE